MARHRHGRPRARATVFDVLAAGLLLAGVAGFASARLVEAGSPPVRVSGTLLAPTTARPPAGAARRPDRQATASEPRATPIELSIPAIGVRTSLVRLSLNSDGTLQVPTSFSVAGWYALGPSPGQTGAAVIVGHVDSRQGPGVFYGLGELAPGSVVQIRLSDRTDVAFRVYAVREFPKASFPTSLVYGHTPRPELRLITCGGPFDAQTGHYLDNIVVFAGSASVRDWPG